VSGRSERRERRVSAGGSRTGVDDEERDGGDEGDGVGDSMYDAQVYSDDMRESSAAKCAREDGNGRDSRLHTRFGPRNTLCDALAARGFRP
jgi:hypothetical protein